ncbi:MAG: hypothetical protein CO093_06285 [Alphaproteobacteria bacterium CG_4_9_14_3_um_filter_47_13]|nr:MAG: hypothetical protein CO093_06285 [Alphaproteobacteria bacterium CG_4_9_14_3_um_filter_47_13]
MTKKIHHITEKRERIVTQALSTARKARETLDPALLEKARDAIGTALESYQNDKDRSLQADSIPVDQKKNLTIIMRYLELHPDNKPLY